MRIRVTYSNDFLGKGTFFDDEYNGEELHNVCATMLARKTLLDGQPHSAGMWSSVVVPTQPPPAANTNQEEEA
jgi:hypothetical protein